METKTNEFAKISKLVDTIITRYREVRKECGIPDNSWHSRTIERMAAPFIKGNFTLAVVGKVSSGKSTFINALLGCKDFLPTGHDQTTCGLTYIEYGKKPEATIVFGEGPDKVIKGDISGKIKQYVAIPEKYHHLPVNNIDDMIMGGFDFNKIWEVHKQLEEETLCPPINKALLKDYVEHRKKKDIAVEVRMKYPFNEELKGWRVIDTPGIGAIGGIETRTKQLLATQKEDGSREVDAIIFLQDGSRTLDETDAKKIVKEQLDNLTETDKDRLFYVLTHSGSSKFINHKEGKIDFIKQNYGSKIKVLTYADSLLYTFLTEFKDSVDGLDEFQDFEQPINWADDEWDAIMDVLSKAQRNIKKKGDSFNHDTMLRTVQEWCHFEELKNDINNFAKNEKQKNLMKLINLIVSDYHGFIRRLDNDKKLVQGDLESINKEIENVEKKKQGYNILAQEADNKIKIDKINAEFDFIEKELQAFESLKNIDSIRTSVTNLFDSVQKKEKEVFETIIKQFSDFFRDFDSTDIVLELDFENIEEEAGKINKNDYILAPEKTVTHWSRPDERIPAKYDNTKIAQEKLRRFKALAFKKARSQRDQLLPQIKMKVDNMRNKIFSEIKNKINEELARLNNLKSQLTRKEEFIAEKDHYIKKTRDASSEIIKLTQDYGYEI